MSPDLEPEDALDAQLQRAGRVEQGRKGGVARAGALFSTDRAPWCPEVF